MPRSPGGRNRRMANEGSVSAPDNSSRSERRAKARPDEHRTRQMCAAKVLEKLIGPLRDCPPRLWSTRAYWLLAGVIYERLTLASGDIETDELIKLSRALTAPGRTRGCSTRRRAKTGARVENRQAMSRAVRELYGLSWPDSDPAVQRFSLPSTHPAGGV